MRPLKITAWLDGPVAGDIPMLDSLVEFRVAHKCDPAYLVKVQPGGKHLPGTLPIPIGRRRVDGFEWPIPLASSPIFHAANDRHDYYARRFDADPASIAPDRSRVFMVNSGELKSYRLPLRTRVVDRVVWFCVGRGADLRQLLEGVKFLGKKTSQGWGAIREWRVDPVADDCSWTADSPAGRVLMRPLPATVASDILGLRKSFGGIVPPYWDAEFFGEAVIPC